MEQKPGFGFRPTDEELISYYLKNKILGNTWLVDDTINEINILNHHPSSFSFTKIKDESGNKIGKKRGILFDDLDAPKAKGEKSSWVIHEYQITSLPHPNLDSYVLYKIFDNNSKKKADISNGNSSSDPSQSLVFDMNTIRVTTSIPPEVSPVSVVKYKGEAADISYEPSRSDSNTTRAINRAAEPELQVEQPGRENFLGMSLDDLEQEDPKTCLQPQGPHLALNDDEFIRGLRHVDREQVEYLFANEENIDGLSMNDLRIPMIVQQEDLSEWDGFNADTFFSDNNNNNNLNVHQLTRYGDDYRNAGYNGGNFEGVHPYQELIMQENRNDHMPKKPLTGTIDYSSDSSSDAGSISTTVTHITHNGGNFEDVFSDLEFIMQENHNDYRPKKSLSGIIADYSSDSDRDAVSISATSYKGTSSPGDSVGSSNRHFLQNFGGEILSLSKDTQTSDEPFISRKTRESQLARCTKPSKPEVTQGMVKTEKKGLFITKEAMERKRENSPYIYLINMIIGFVLFLALINDIISV
ncbi:hypothetical protein ARALYDRAFT_352687 [Arabidopsis lyrata subsp. lyrata]|uniref:NAC domain-containing protein n=1 Tax=Arabidopsis lyrata subsp. lyrata TaxID=81972 RepID=D7M4U3_ARALL|nr:hypothetical protein ARALYDRAFT_352687 [Arabidopsis lyrata subsp. lyrata]